MPIKITCDECGDEFTVPPSNSEQKYCSRECYLYKNNPNKEEKVSVNCDWCDSNIQRIPSLVERTENNFCDQKCSSKWRSENWTGERSPTYKDASVECTCEWCGSDYEEWSTRKERTRFCSLECRNKWQSSRDGPEHPLYKGGRKEFGENWKEMRREALSHYGEECSLCGADSSNSLIDVHHIIPRWLWDNVDDADKLWNLTPLCRSHHMKVERQTEKVIEKMAKEEAENIFMEENWEIDTGETLSIVSNRCSEVLRRMIDQKIKEEL